MKEKREVMVVICDVCKKIVDYVNSCEECGMEVCYDCRKKNIITYIHGVHFSGSGDGYYCHKCDSKLRKNGDLKLAAYIVIAALRQEEKLWFADFRKRSDAAEKKLQRLISKK